MTATLQFSLPEEDYEFRAALQGRECKRVIADLDNWLREFTKYQDREKWPDAQAVRDELLRLVWEAEDGHCLLAPTIPHHATRRLRAGGSVSAASTDRDHTRPRGEAHPRGAPDSHDDLGPGMGWRKARRCAGTAEDAVKQSGPQPGARALLF